MATRKVYINVGVRLVVEIEEGVEVGTVMDEIDYSFIPVPEQATVVDTEITNWEVMDSK